MAYAVFYCHEDFTMIAANVEATLRNDYDQWLTVQERNLVKQTFQRAWTGGLNRWATAPVAPPPYQDGPEWQPTLIVVVSGPQVSKASLITALQLLANKVPNTAYMGAIARDLAGESGCMEPWPPV